MRWCTIAVSMAFCLEAATAHAQQLTGAPQWADSARRLIDDGMRRGERRELQRAVALLDRALTAYPDHALLLHYRGFGLYRQVNISGGSLPKDERDLLLDEAERALERSAEVEAIPETYALLSSVLGEKIGDSPFRGMTLGPRSGRMIDRAVELGPNNPRVWMLRGVGAMFTPRLFGGGLEKAESFLLRAVELFAHDTPSPPAPAWGHEEVWAWLGQVYRRTDRFAEARQAYAKALEIQPEFGWVTHVLLPALDRVENP